MADAFLEKNTIIKFIGMLRIDENRKKTLLEKLPSFTDEEKVFLWKTLLDIYRLDKEKKDEIRKVKKYL
ncbi:MAG: hypothetical protein PHI88_02365 [Candidatus Pacebacteria bacterium]|nr:hypothetical protein [Candidatus Paceibacterota bacterium]